MNNLSRYIINLLFIVIFIVFSSELMAASSENILDNIIKTYKNVSSTWTVTIKNHALNIFYILAVISFAWGSIKLALEGSVWKDFVVYLIKSIAFISFFYTILFFGDTWMLLIIDSVREIGADASGISGLSPSKIFELGIELASKIMAEASVINIADTLVMFLSAIIVLICFMLIAAIMLLAIVEAYFVLSVGMFLLAFGATHWTKEHALKQINLALSVGIKLMSLQLIIGVGQKILADFINVLGDSTINEIFVVLGASVVLLVLVQKIPDLLQSIINGVSINTGTDVISTGTGLAATAGSIASGVAKHSIAGSTAIKEAAKLASSQGVKGPMGLATATAKNLGSALKNDFSAKLSGNPSARFGTLGSRLASNMKEQRLSTNNSSLQGSISKTDSSSSPSNKKQTPLSNYKNTKNFIKVES